MLQIAIPCFLFGGAIGLFYVIREYLRNRPDDSRGES